VGLIRSMHWHRWLGERNGIWQVKNLTPTVPIGSSLEPSGTWHNRSSSSSSSSSYNWNYSLIDHWTDLFFSWSLKLLAAGQICINLGLCVDSYFEHRVSWRAPWKNRTSRYISFSAHHSMVFYFRRSVYWWKGSVRF